MDLEVREPHLEPDVKAWADGETQCFLRDRKEVGTLLLSLGQETTVVLKEGRVNTTTSLPLSQVSL